MYIFILSFIIFALILMFPFLLACFIKFDDGRETSLIVKNDNIKDPRYFSKSFKAKMRESLPEVKDTEHITLSKEERIFNWNRVKNHLKEMDQVIHITEDTEINDKNVFAKEIYAEGALHFGERNKIRAVAGEKNVFLGEKTTVSRWADAEELLVAKKFSNLGISATAGDRLVIEPQCVFGRLYAPRIEVNSYTEMIDKYKEEIIVNRIAPVYKSVVRDVTDVPEGSELRKTVISRKKFTVGAGAIVYGDIKSDDTVHIKKGAIVTGNVFADDAVIIEENAKVLGNVYGTEDVYIGPNARIGIIGRIKSVVSRSNMVIAEGAIIYGYVGTERYGRTVNVDDFADEVRKYEHVKIKDSNAAPAKDFERIKCNVNAEGYVYLDSVEEYNEIDYYGFRNSEKLIGMIIPEGAEVINPSMFLGCKNLEYVKIPKSVKEIGEYAFYECDKLKKVEFETGTKLDIIGEYAFSECDSLEKINLPMVAEVSNAVFRNDKNLQELTVSPTADGIKCAPLALHKCYKLKINGLAPYIQKAD